MAPRGMRMEAGELRRAPPPREGVRRIPGCLVPSSNKIGQIEPPCRADLSYKSVRCYANEGTDSGQA